MMNKKTVLLICTSIFLLSTILSVYMMTPASGIEELTEPVYVEIADYFDNRKAVVTVTADDWKGDNTAYFEDMSSMLTTKNIYFTGAVETSSNPSWSQIQYWLNQGYLEVASHSRTHPHTPYDSYDSQIGGSKQDIIGNLTLPNVFSFSGNEYIYSWIEPYGDSDSMVRQKLGEYKYLADRSTSIDDEWATWDSVNGLFDRIGFSIQMEPRGVDDVPTLNAKFDSVYNTDGIYHLFTHPRNVNWEPGEYADLHTSYISNRKDVWYVNFGLLYLYHWIDTQNVTQVTSTGSLQDKVFKISISSTDHQNYGAKYPVTYVFDIPPSWTNGYVNYRFQEADPWTTMETKTSSDFFNGINAVRFDFSNHTAYVSIGFDDASDEIYLQILPQDSEPTANFTASPTSGPEPLTVSFTDTSTSYDGIILWNWSFGDGAFEESVSPTHTYAQDGGYLVTLTVSEADGSTDSTSQTITVADTSPVADFSAMPTSGDEPLAVSFTDLSTSYDGIVGWTWNFGDGQSSIEQNPTHVYAADGTYTVSLMVLEADGNEDIEIKTNYITVADTAPTADFSYLPSSAALTIDFTDTSTSYDAITDWEWDFGDGETSTELNPTHRFPDDGTFEVSLTVTDADGSTDSITKQVSVLNVAPTADFNIVSSPKPTIDEDITFLDLSSDPDGSIVSWFWDLGDGNTSTSQNVTHRYYTLGTFIVNLTVTDDDGETDTTSKSITIYDVVPPATVDDYDGLWHTSDFTINLTATDDISGVQNVYYIINDGPVMDVRTHGQPRISVEGYNKLEYWGVDFYGNEETHHVIRDIKLDKTSRARAMWIVGGIVLAIATSAAGIIIFWHHLNKTPTLRKEKEEN